MFHRLPYSVVALAGVGAGLEILFSLGELIPDIWTNGDNLRLVAVRDFGFWGLIFSYQVEEFLWLTKETFRIFSYSFIHLQATDAIFSVVFVLVWGRLLGQQIDDRMILLIYFLATTLGALGYGLILATDYPLLGASAGYFGLMGGFIALLVIDWVNGGNTISSIWPVPVFFLSCSVGSQLLFGGPGFWLADLIGFVTGWFCLLFMLFGFRGTYVLTQRLFNKFFE